MQRRFPIILAAIAILATACGDDGDATATSRPATTAAPTTTAPPAPTAPPITSATPAPTAAPAALRFTGADGVESVIEDTSRVVVLNGDLVEVIYELGAADRIAAVDVTATYPPAADELPKIGFGQQLAAEAVLSFGPTLVIGDELVAPQESIDQIRAAGIPVVILETQTTLGGVATKIREVASLLGLDEEGASLAARVEEEIEDARLLAAGATDQQNVAFIYVRGPETLLLFGQGMVTQAMIEGANAVDSGAVAGVRGAAPLTPEALVAAAPDVIVVPSLGLAALGGIAELVKIPGVAETPAGREGRFLAYEDTFFLNFGPRTGEALRRLVLDLYPGLAADA